MTIPLGHYKVNFKHRISAFYSKEDAAYDYHCYDYTGDFANAPRATLSRSFFVAAVEPLPGNHKKSYLIMTITPNGQSLWIACTPDFFFSITTSTNTVEPSCETA